MATLSPVPILRFNDNNGNPLVGGKLYTYQAGTTTPQATYTDVTGTTPNSNPVILNSRGEASVWLTAGQAYKFDLKDASGNEIYTVDQVNTNSQSGVVNSLTTIVGTNTITAACSAITSLSLNQIFSGIATNTNTGAVTLNINSLGAISVVANGIALTGGELSANMPFQMYYDGSKFNLMVPSAFPLLGNINEAQGANIASSATLNLTASTGNYVHVTGTTTITAITLPQGAERTVVFDGSLTLTNGASLILPGGANILTAAGDSAKFRGEAAGVVRCINYQTASGLPLVIPVPAGTILAHAGSTIPTGFLLCPISATPLTIGTVGSAYYNLYLALGGASSPWGSPDAFATQFYYPWFAADTVPVQANSNLASTTAGQIPSHQHTTNPWYYDSASTNTGGSTCLMANSTNSSGSTSFTVGAAGSGTNNLAAGTRTKFIVKY